MRGVLALVLLAACEQLFQVSGVNPNDGPHPDMFVPGDAGPYCPSLFGDPLGASIRIVGPVRRCPACSTPATRAARSAGGNVRRWARPDVCSIVGTEVMAAGTRLDVSGPRPLVIVAWDTFNSSVAIDVGSRFKTSPKIGAGRIGGLHERVDRRRRGHLDRRRRRRRQLPASRRLGGASTSVSGQVGMPGAAQGAGLRGGCAGGLGGGNTTGGGDGGGALAILAQNRIIIGGDLMAGGAGGRHGDMGNGTSTSGFGGTGGGAGGTMILDAPTILIAIVHVCANGGGGGGGGGISIPGTDGGDACTSDNSAAAGGPANGGSGSTYATVPGAGSGSLVGAGGGGGGAGWILVRNPPSGVDYSPLPMLLTP